MNWKYFLSLFLFLSISGHAIDYPYYQRSPKGLLMGDAFTAINDDAFTLFYNPASLGRMENDLVLYPFNPAFSATNVFSDMDKFEDFPSTPVGASNVLMDFPAHGAAGVTPGFKIFNIGVSFIGNESYDVLLRNRTHPMLDIDTRSDRGFIMGFGVPIGTSRISKRSKMGMQTSLGFSAKYIERTGLKDTLALTGTTSLNALGKNQIDDIVDALGQVKGIGWGFDAGFEHVMKFGPNRIVMGLSALDITSTEFKVDENHNPNKLAVANTRDQVNLGLAVGQDVKLLHWNLSLDARGLNEQMDFGKRMRLGAEFGIPGLTLMGGINSGYYSYGFELNLLFMKFTAGLYDIELGTQYKQIKSKRFILYLSLFDFSFDA